MKKGIDLAMDARQTDQWGYYLQQMNWITQRVEKALALIKPLPILPYSVIKMLHPFGPLPFKEIDKLARKYNTLYIVIEPHTYKYDETVFKKNGYRKSFIRYTHTATIKIDLQLNEDKLFQSFSENARRNIKKAQSNKLRLETIWLDKEKNNEKFEQFYQLLLNLKSLKRFYIPDHDEYIKKMNAFKKTSILLFAYEKNGKKPIAAVWLAHYKNVISYFQTGITQKGYDVLANYWLVWEGLKLAKKLKLTVFDFETIFDPRYPKDHESWRGYSEFKKRFHGTIIEYPPSWIKIYNPLFKFIYICSAIFMK